MANEAENAIYNRLVNAPVFHPSSTDIFASDWSLEPGDVVTVYSNGEQFNTPVYSMDFEWKAINGGENKVKIQSTGNQKREPLPALKRHQYGGGSSAYHNNKEYWTKFEQTDYEISLVAAHADKNGDILEQAGMHLDAQGVLVYAEDHENNIAAKLNVTASQIRSEVSGSLSGIYTSVITQTESYIRSEVSNSVSGIYTSVIEQTGSYIRSEVVAAASNITASVIEQTASYVRTEVTNALSDATGTIYNSVIEQTQSYIHSEVQSKSKVYAQWDNPTSTAAGAVQNGDIWVKTNSKRTWNDLWNDNWDNPQSFNWADYLGAEVYVRKGDAWELVTDEQQNVASATAIQQSNNQIRLFARELNAVDSRLYSNYAEFKITATQIRSEVAEQGSQLNSTITQTASQIRSEVSASNSALSSTITQTASQIRSEVRDGLNDTRSTITQTASQIRSEVSASNSSLSSSITQTASQIRAEVDASNSSLSSSITQTASQIRSEVNAANSSLSSTIAQTASQIRAEVNASNSALSSSITQTAAQIRTEVRSSLSGLGSSITQNANRIAIVVDSSSNSIKGASIVASVNALGGSSVKINASRIDLAGYVTASELSAVSASITNLSTGVSTASAIRVTRLIVRGNACEWFNVTAQNGIFKLLGTYD